MTKKESDIEFLAKCAADTSIFARAFMPERFKRPFDKVQRDIVLQMDRRPGQPGYKPQKATAGFRGSGKTSLIGYALPAKKIVFQETNYIIYIASSEKMAMEKTDGLRVELETNPLIRHYFGDVKTKAWGKEKFEVQVGSHLTTVVPKGAEQRIRGALNSQGYRPDLLLVDDVEDPDDLDSEDVRAKKKKRFHANVKNLIDRGAPLGSWEIHFLGNVLHQSSLILELCASRFWDSQILPLCDDEFQSYSPNFMDDAACQLLYEEFLEAEQSDVWFREYMCSAVPMGEHRAFQESYFQPYNEAELRLAPRGRNWTVVVIDPSRTANPRAAYTGIVCWSIDTESNKVYVRDVRRGKWHPDEQYDQLSRVIKMYKCDAVGVEITGLHEFVTHPLKTFLRQRGHYLEVLELHARRGTDEKGKAERVRSLVDWYKSGLVYHNPATCNLLEQQLLSFPSARDWSLMDPLGYLNAVLEMGEIYLNPGYDEYRTKPEDIEAEYAELVLEEEEYELLDNFRMV